MKKILTALLMTTIFCFMSGMTMACGTDCKCGCQQGKECTCKKDCECDCNCEETGECGCDKCDCKCGCSEGKCKCKKKRKFILFRKKQIKCNCEE